MPPLEPVILDSWVDLFVLYLIIFGFELFGVFIGYYLGKTENEDADG